MIFAVIFEDNPAAGADVRRRLMESHLAFLERNAAHIKAAGPLQSSNGDAAGGLWLVEAETPEQVDAFVRDDPFWPTGLRRSVKILRWSQVFADGQRKI
jgi:uncharacterized protein